MRNDLAALIITVLLLPALSIGLPVQAGDAKPTPAEENAASGQGRQVTADSKSEPPAAKPNPTKLHCRATRTDLGMYEPLRVMSITIDPTKRYVKVVHEGDGQTFEFTDGSTSVQGSRNFVKVTEETIVYGQGRRLMEDRSLYRHINKRLDCHPLRMSGAAVRAQVLKPRKIAS